MVYKLLLRPAKQPGATEMLVSDLEGRIRDMRRACEIMQDMICNDGDREHIHWMADKLKEDSAALEAALDEAFENARTTKVAA